jgi:tRNA G18 (ribose-2'-O)-methylase SpoU
MPAAIIPVTSLEDPALAEFRLNERALSNRAERRDDAGAGRFLAEGDLVVERALDAGCRPVAVLADAGRLPDLVQRLLAGDQVAGGPIDVYAGDETVRRMITGLGVPHRIVALFLRPPRQSAADLLAQSRRIVILDGVDNPANVGSIIRNAAALSFDAVITDHSSADPLARRSLRVAMGTAFTLPHARTSDLAGLLAGDSARDLDLIALTPDLTAPAIDEIHLRHERRAVLIGSERNGLSPAVLAAATHRVRIPMAAGVDSLNAASATAIACYLLGR